jgi:hypothetical protein
MYYRFVITMTFFLTAALQAQDIQPISANCGDHWYGMQITFHDIQNKATVTFDGDSGPEVQHAKGLYTITNNEIRINLTSPAGAVIIIKKEFTNWWSYYKAKPNAEITDLAGICRIYNN